MRSEKNRRAYNPVEQCIGNGAVVGIRVVLSEIGGVYAVENNYNKAFIINNLKLTVKPI
jgi:hypothetical protein